MEAQLFEWLSKAFGPGIAAGVFLYVYALKNKPKDDDPVSHLFDRMDQADTQLRDLNTRLARIEGRMSQ